MKSLALSKYFEVVHPKYVYLKLTPTNSIRNYNSDKIAKVVACFYKNLKQQITHRNKKLFFNLPCKLAYYIYVTKNNIEFYFITPEQNLHLIREKIGDTWKGITVKKVDILPNFSDEAIKYRMEFTKDDSLSLAIDKRTNTLLGSILNVVEVMDSEDKIGVFFNFTPCDQLAWKAEWRNAMAKMENGMPIDKGAKLVRKTIIAKLLQFVDSIFDTINNMTGVKTPKETNIRSNFRLTESTERKKNSLVIKTQIAVISDSPDETRRINNALSVCEAFDSVSSDNTLTYKKISGKKPLDFNSYSLKGIPNIKISTLEAQNFIALPGKELLQDYNMIEKINTLESEVPPELQTGVMFLGLNTYRGIKTPAYLSNDKHYRNLAYVVVAPTRGGKSTLLSNLAKNALDNDECVILFDYCGNCELSDDVSSVIRNKPILNIDCSDLNNLQGLGFNEIDGLSGTVQEQYDFAKKQATQVSTLIDAINVLDLSGKMDKYLESAAVVVFINHGSIKDVFQVLQDHRLRHEYLDKIPKEQEENLEDHIFNLTELDEIDNKGNLIGTRTSKVTGIFDRLTKLKQNTHIELMLKKDCSNNFNLVDEMQKNQLICLKMPEIMFSTQGEKDVYCVYWLSKLWLSLQIRKWLIQDEDKRVKVNLFIDELYQVPHTQQLLTDKLSQMAKFTCKSIISAHYLSQISIIRNELRSANCSYSLISGCDKANFEELKDELDPYEVEDLLHLERYHALHLIKNNEGQYSKFITKLPPPVR